MLIFSLHNRAYNLGFQERNGKCNFLCTVTDIYDDVTYFEVCVFIKNKNLNILRTKHFFFKSSHDTLMALIWQKNSSGGNL